MPQVKDTFNHLLEVIAALSEFRRLSLWPVFLLSRFPGVRLRPFLPAGSPQGLGGEGELAVPESLPVSGDPELLEKSK